ncbi:MAG: hypothetical protein N2738_07790, partial [Thermodesulfovibrionales bacterium]|nr:hypothetical protein [Thermodesulfovibrionales bacterium]
MKKGYFAMFLCVFACVLLIGIVERSADAQKAKPKEAKATQVDVNVCYGCHTNIKDFHAKGKHAKINCAECHSDTNLHLADSKNKPVTNLDLSNCGRCHKEQYESLVHVNLESKPKVEKATSTSRSPLFDAIMMPHGFTREHAEPRSHVFMLVDHLLVDRAYGGRFQLKSWQMISDAKSSEKSAWSVLKDLEPNTNEQKLFKPYTARTGFTAANPVCFQCKTSDFVLKWAYMGDKNPRAKWDRTSNVVEVARDSHRPMSCI